jgi:hypothetical protein
LVEKFIFQNNSNQPLALNRRPGRECAEKPWYPECHQLDTIGFWTSLTAGRIIAKIVYRSRVDSCFHIIAGPAFMHWRMT